MQTGLVISIAMVVISFVLAAAMLIVWNGFNRPRHAASWGIAYLLYGIEVIANATGLIVHPLYFYTEMLAFACILAPATLVAIGARQRAGLPPWRRRLGLVAVAVFVIGELLRHGPAPWWLPATDGVFTTAMLGIALIAIRPRGRAPEPAEWATMGAILLFMAFEMVLVVLDLRSIRNPDDTMAHTVFMDVYLAGLTPVFVANGVAAVLLIASDLARQLQRLASRDPLTGVLNRRGFEDAALRAIANGRRHRQPVALIIADIDHFKSINDRFGHTAGDRTLVAIAAHLATGLRHGDLVGRIGGEEFALLLVNSPADEAASAVERVREEIARDIFIEAMPIPVTASFGVASVTQAPGSIEIALAQALDQADRALYRSKVDGRNRTTLAPPVAA